MKKSSVAGMVARYSGIILLLPACMLIGYGIGGWLGRYLEMSPTVSIVGALFGSFAGLIQVFKILREKP
jgi:F0F1-type ATP synthase assembly protein I